MAASRGGRCGFANAGVATAVAVITVPIAIAAVVARPRDITVAARLLRYAGRIRAPPARPFGAPGAPANFRAPVRILRTGGRSRDYVHPRQAITSAPLRLIYRDGRTGIFGLRPRARLFRPTYYAPRPAYHGKAPATKGRRRIPDIRA